MHELSITRNIVAIVGERANGARVTQVTIEVGKWSAVAPDAIRFCFDVVAKGTVLEGAQLEVIEVPGRARCRSCGHEMELENPIVLCLCGSANLERLSGEELTIQKMVIV